MRGVLLALALALGAVAIVPRAGHADGPASCGVPARSPVWIDYAGHDAPITPKPGMVLAVSSGTVVPGQMRAAGAATIFFDLHLNDRVGTPSEPADPATIADNEKREVGFAVQGR